MSTPQVVLASSAVSRSPNENVREAEEAILDYLTARLNGVVSEELTEGGSPARLVRVETPDADSRVIKLLVDIPGAVDGHDLESFRVKIRQIEKVRRETVALRNVYTDLCEEFHGDDWAAYTMPFYRSRDIAEPLRLGESPDARFFPEVRAILDDLISRGYLHASIERGPGHLAEVHGDRFVRRFWLLRKYLPASLTEADRIVVNRMSCRNPLLLAQYIIDDPSLTADLDATRLYFPVHGDLNTRNILVTDERALASGAVGGYRIIDPRGTLDHWDPAYDLSKILFSLTVWDAGLRKGFAIDGSPTDGWTVGIQDGNCPEYVSAAHRLLATLRDIGAFQELTERDPGWEGRYLLGHAFHLLGEAACRLSDIKKRTNEDTRSRLSPIDLATGHYLYGILFLEDAVCQLETGHRIDHDRALRFMS